MNRLEKLIQELCPNGVKFTVLNTVCEIYDGTHQTPNYTYSGVKFVSVENIGDLNSTSKYISEEDYLKYKIKPQKDDVLMTRIGSVGACAVIESNEKMAYYVSLALLRPDKKVLNSKYLKYTIESLHGRKELRKRTLVNAVPIKINMGDIGKITIPLPPLEIQYEIVRILDYFTELTAKIQSELTTELIARKRQYTYYMSNLLSEGHTKFPVTELANIANFSYGYTDNAGDGGDARFIRITDIMDNGCLNQENKKYIKLSEDSKKYLLKKGDIVMARTGATYGKTLYIPDDTPAVYASFLIKITLDNTKILNRFYWHYAQSSLYWSQANKLVSTGGQPQFNTAAISRVKVPTPSLDSQRKIVEVLDNFEVVYSKINVGLTAEIEARQKQYEYYRDRLLTFRGDT